MCSLEYDIIKHFEPIGKENQKYNEWEKIDRELSLILNPFLEVSIKTKQVQALEVSNPAAQVEVSNPATESMDGQNNTEEETKTAKDNHVENTKVATGEPTIDGYKLEESISFVSGAALDSHHINKKVKQDFGFFWGGVLGQVAWRKAKLVNAQYIHLFKDVGCTVCSLPSHHANRGGHIRAP
jgi:hypothetical protein